MRKEVSMQCSELRSRRDDSVLCAPGAHMFLVDTCTDNGIYRRQTYCRNCFHTEEEIDKLQSDNKDNTAA